MGRFEALVGKTVPVMLKAGDQEILVELKPLGISYLPKFLKLMKGFQAAGDGVGGTDIGKVDEETASTLVYLVMAQLKNSIPDEKQETLEIIAQDNFNLLVEKIVEVNWKTALEEQQKKLKALQSG
jgi:hypothetical protein